MTAQMLASRRLHSKAGYTQPAPPAVNYWRELARFDKDKAQEVLQAFRPPHGPTRAQLKAHLRQLLAVSEYAKAVMAGSKAPLVAVADALEVDAVKARNLIQFARQSGYLTSPGQGRSGGSVTLKAVETAREWGVLS